MLILALLACKGPTCPEPTLTVDGTDLSLEAGDCGGLDLSARVEGEGELDLELILDEDGAITPVVTGQGTLTALVLEGDYTLQGQEPARLWRQGYQSWSWSGVTELESVEYGEDGLPAVDGDGDIWSLAAEPAWSSWWGGLVGHPDGASLMAGALTAERLKTWLAVDQERLVLVQGGRGERLAVSGEEALEPLHLDLGSDPFALYEGWGTAVAAHTPPRPMDALPPVGWATWTVYYEDIDEEGLLAELAASRQAEGLELFQVDDGWSPTWGEWEASERFASGMDALADAIQSEGLRPGLWMAPLYVDVDLEVVAEHPEWFVHTAEGELLTWTNLGVGTYAIVDVTHLEAAVWMQGQVAARYAEGWTYLKLDFLYAGAQEGVRSQDVTGLQAYHLALDLLREAAPEAWILACGAPMLPSVGWADSFRTGADIALTMHPDPDPAFLRWQGRATAARSWQSGLWWWNDADQLLVRQPLTEAQATGAVVASAVSGGTWLLGDSLVDGERQSLALAPELVDLRGLRWRPRDPLSFASGKDAGPLGELAQPDDQVPVEWRSDQGHLALLNLSDAEVEAVVEQGVELLSGEEITEPTVRTLAPGAGEIWAPLLP